MTALMPMPTSRDAPHFVADVIGFEAFFDDVNELGNRATLTDKDKIRWACRYASSESEAWLRVPCMTAANANPTFATFRGEVLKIYPQLADGLRYTLSDLQRLVDGTSSRQSLDREELGKYY